VFFYGPGFGNSIELTLRRTLILFVLYSAVRVLKQPAAHLRTVAIIPERRSDCDATNDAMKNKSWYQKIKKNTLFYGTGS